MQRITIRSYDLPTVRDITYKKQPITCEEPHPCRCDLKAEMLEVEAIAAGKARWYDLKNCFSSEAVYM